jgi:hypothetical protein
MASTSVSTKLITKAIIAVMMAVKGIDKSLNVGSGNNSYKGVADQDVKSIIGKSMEAHGLCLVPIDIDPTLQIDRWEEPDPYSKIQGATKQKQQVFTSVKTKYLLMHESGEWIELQGYGHGVDSQDKAAGKATTYALKYTLLYTFLVPTGKIDDADQHASDGQDAPPAKRAANGSNGTPAAANTNGKTIEKALFSKGTPEWDKAIKSLENGESTATGKKITVAAILKAYRVNKDDIKLLEEAEKKGQLPIAVA